MQAGMMGQEPPSLGTTRLMLLLGLIFQLLIALYFFGFLGLGSLFALATLGIFAVVFAVVFLIFGVFSLIMLYVAYEFCYKRVQNRQYEQAKGPLLVVAIIELIFGGVLPGIFYIIAYLKLGDVINETRQPPAGWAPGYGQQPGMPMGQPYYAPMPGQQPGYAAPPGQQQAYASPPGQGYPAAASPPPTPGVQPYPPAAAPAPPAAPTCPRCSRPATFVPQYNRYYCYNCAQYL